MRYAEVVVNVPTYVQRATQAAAARAAGEDVRVRLAQTFHYAIPAALQDRLGAGHLVQVPFGKQEVQGIVVALSEESPVAQARYVSALQDEMPVVSPAQIELARWMSQYYLVSFFSALQVMLPPGMEQRSRLVVTMRWEGPLPPDLPAEAGQVAALLQKKSPLRSDQLDRHLPEALWRKGVDQLAARRLVSATAQLTPPTARVRMEQLVRAIAAEPRQALLASPLCRAAKEAAISRRLDKYLPILEFLAREGKPVWVGAVYAETGANSAALRKLADAGLVAFLQQERIRDPLAGLDFVPDQPLRLTPDQERTWQIIEAALAKGEPGSEVYLLHGVTGSGKTEIYLRALDRVLGAGRQGIVP